MTPYVADTDFTLYVGDVRQVLATMPDGSVDCCVTSPPYWGLRDYQTGTWAGGDDSCDHLGEPFRTKATINANTGTGTDRKNTEGRQPMGQTCSKCGATRTDSQIGLEATPEAFVAEMVAVFREVRRVLADHGTCWVNLGDSYSHGGNGSRDPEKWPKQSRNNHRVEHAKAAGDTKPKDLVGIPWRVARALQQPWMRCSLCGEERAGHQWATMPPTGAFPIGYVVCPACSCPSPSPEITESGWYLRSDIIWSKPNPMPESVTDRPTKSHEYVFLLTKQPRYFFDQEAVRERYADPDDASRYRVTGDVHGQSPHGATRAKGPDGRKETRVAGADGSIQHRDGERWPNGGRNVRTVWEIATQPYAEAHFATFPEALPERCIKAGCPERVCATCGTPRTRIVERTTTKQGEAYEDRMERVGASIEPLHQPNRASAQVPTRYNLSQSAAETVGWSDCGHDNWRAGRVLDPFMGSGTTALVARRLGRHSVGVELNPDYAALCARRLQQLSLLAGEPAA